MPLMRAILINTGTELLLGDVQDAHLAFIAREIFPLGLRIEERRTVPDTRRDPAIRWLNYFRVAKFFS